MFDSHIYIELSDSSGYGTYENLHAIIPQAFSKQKKKFFFRAIIIKYNIGDKYAQLIYNYRDKSRKHMISIKKRMSTELLFDILDKMCVLFSIPHDKNNNVYYGRQLYLKIMNRVWSNIGPANPIRYGRTVSVSRKNQLIYTTATRYLENQSNKILDIV